ncbi:MAG: aminotransferase class I and II [Gemmatimonadetes bacterium]|nr:aminotransferase class I and II [Gemmatimonadota bacterium]
MTAAAPPPPGGTLDLPRLTATRYVQPLREGGTLPAVVDTHGGGLFVAKFRGAGQGAKALVAELVVGLLARAAGLPVPELALIELLPDFGRSEPDPEIQDLLRASEGVNVGLRYLDGAFNFDARAAGDMVSPALAARIVWLDAFTTNPDRTGRNANLLVWDHRLWLIDHGAALYAQHNWPGVDEARTRTPFPLIRDHVLLPLSGSLEEADAELAALFTDERIAAILRLVPDELWEDPALAADFPSAAAARERYGAYLTTRLREPRAFVAEAVEARERRLREPPRPLSSRR